MTMSLLSSLFTVDTVSLSRQHTHSHGLAFHCRRVLSQLLSRRPVQLLRRRASSSLALADLALRFGGGSSGAADDYSITMSFFRYDDVAFSSDLRLCSVLVMIYFPCAVVYSDGRVAVCCLPWAMFYHCPLPLLNHCCLA